MRTPSQSELAGSFPVWLCEIDWHGRKYRFSTYPLTLEDSAETIAFDGGLEDPDFSQKMESISTDIEDDGITLELVFSEDLVRMLMVEGLSLDRASGEISYVLEKGGIIQQTYVDRFKLFSGDVIQPIIGDPSKPVGYVALSLERNPLNRPVRVIREDQVIILDANFDTAHDTSAGQIMPFVFGIPGGFLEPSGSTYATRNPFCTPAIICAHTMGALPDGEDAIVRLLIAGHHVRASKVYILDYFGNSYWLDVDNTVTVGGVDYARASFAYGTWDGATLTKTTGLVHPWMSGAETSTPTYWAGWSDTYGGGAENTWSSGELTKAGDIIRYFLALTGVDVDFQAWANVAPALNGYEFAGFINDPEVSAYEWLMDNILPLLPVEVVNGPDGLRPVLSLLISPQYMPPTGALIEGVGVYLHGPLRSLTEPDDILNGVSLRYGWSGVIDDYRVSFSISGSPRALTGELAGATEIARLSYSRFGDRYEEHVSPYIYHEVSAAKVARLLIRKRALIWREVEFIADPEWGWLHVGDVIELSSSSLHLSRARLQISQKRWEKGGWIFSFIFEENPALNMRSIT